MNILENKIKEMESSFVSHQLSLSTEPQPEGTQSSWCTYMDQNQGGPHLQSNHGGQCVVQVPDGHSSRCHRDKASSACLHTGAGSTFNKGSADDLEHLNQLPWKLASSPEKWYHSYESEKCY